MTTKPDDATDAKSLVLRRAYLQIIAALRSMGRHAEAVGCAEQAVALGLWKYPQQRPVEYVEGLRAQPAHDSAAFPLCGYLESWFSKIQQEIVGSLPSTRFDEVEEPLTNEGWWGEIVFYENGIRYPGAMDRFPVTAQAVDGLPDEVKSCGVVMLSMLAPHTHIMPHCGHTNARLRVHLGILATPDSVLRVHDRYLEWHPGRCLVFDDSFEHEVWHYGDQPRIVLLLDMPHPDIGSVDRSVPMHAEVRERAAQFMTERGIRAVRRTDDGVIVEPDGYYRRFLERHLDELNTASIVLGPDGELRTHRAE